MPQKKKVVKKDIKKVTKTKPPSKDSINIKVGLQDILKLTCAGCAAEKKKPRRKKRQPAQTTTDNNNVSYVDESGIPVSNEIINNRSFNRSYMPQPFSRNSSVIGTTFNESSIIDKVAEKMSRLNTSNQSMNNTVLNQSTAAPTPARPAPAPARTQALSTIAPASPSIAPQSLNFDLSSRAGLTPLQASSIALNSVQQYAMREAFNLQETIARIFKGVSNEDQAVIDRATRLTKATYKNLISLGSHGGAQFSIFVPYFKAAYKGSMVAKDAASLAWELYKVID